MRGRMERSGELRCKAIQGWAFSLVDSLSNGMRMLGCFSIDGESIAKGGGSRDRGRRLL